MVPIIDRGETEAAWVLVMPRAEKSLRQHLEEAAPLALDQSIAIVRDIATALADLNGRVVHRDLKPENVLRLNGSWCLADFGIARYAEASTAPDTRKYSMTDPYAAPEQWRFDRATAATDIYALGVVAYELLTGSRPFQGPSREDFREQHLHALPPVMNGVPTPLRSLFEECLLKAPAARPAAANILSRLDRFVASPTSAALHRLYEANELAVQRQAETSREAARERSEMERRSELYTAGQRTFASISDELLDAIASSASQASIDKNRDGGWRIQLSAATLELAAPRPADRNPWGGWEPPDVDVIAYSTINLAIPANSYNYRGRGHSLWFCNAQSPDQYSWFEIAFMNNAFMSGSSLSVEPYPLNPGEKAAKALWRGISEYQVARQFTKLEPGNLEEFVERWINWFADAASGVLQYPDHLPEKR